MASGASAGFFAGMLDLDIVVEQGVAHCFSGRRFNDGPFRAESGMGQYDNLWHVFSLSLQYRTARFMSARSRCYAISSSFLPASAARTLRSMRCVVFFLVFCV